MKKILFLVFILALIFTLAACGDDTSGNTSGGSGNDQTPDSPPHTHSFVEGKCECGATDPNYVPPHTHSFVEGKCECGATDPNYVPPHTHSFVEGKCECGATDPNYVPPHTHSFVEGKCECGETDPDYKPELKEINGISFVDATYTYDGKQKTVEISGDLPDGVKVIYSSNSGTDAGTYNATATISGEGYKTKVLTAKLTIQKANIDGVRFDSYTGTYNGSQQMVIITDALPADTDVEYKNNKAFNAGTYHATATITGKNYNTLVLYADLIINKADITGISAESNQSLKENGSLQKPAFSGAVPSGVSIKYYFNGNEASGVSGVGNYTVKIVFSGSNYNTLTLTVDFSIKRNIDLSGLASKVIDAFGSVPNPWSFLPDSFNKTNFSSNATLNYDDFVGVFALPTNGMGKQLNMVYGVVTKADTALGYVNKVYGVMNIIKTLYTAFLDSSPEEYKYFSDTAAGITFAITLTEDKYELSASVGSVEIKIFSNLKDDSYGARIQLTETTILKYTVADNEFTVALDILDSISSMLKFERNSDGTVTGMIYEYAGIAGIDVISHSAMINIGKSYTVIIGTKGDFLIGSEGRNSEVYDNKTGKYVGSEVREDTITGVYNTYWFPLNNLSGVYTIKKLDEKNGTNPDKIWINGCEDTLHSKLYGGWSTKTASRRFDIEFKEVYFFNYDEESGEYTAASMEIPMLFIQEEKLADFVNDFSKENEVALDGAKVALTTSSAVKEAIAYGYDELLPIYDEAKDSVTKENIQEWCKN